MYLIGKQFKRILWSPANLIVSTQRNWNLLAVAGILCNLMVKDCIMSANPCWCKMSVPRREVHAHSVTLSHNGESSWTFMKILDVKMTHFSWIIFIRENSPSAWSFMDFYQPHLCHFNMSHFHENSWSFMNLHEISWIIRAFFHHISWTFMKIHELFQLGGITWRALVEL